jgi:hypothetical protein
VYSFAANMLRVKYRTIYASFYDATKSKHCCFYNFEKKVFDFSKTILDRKICARCIHSYHPVIIIFPILISLPVTTLNYIPHFTDLTINRTEIFIYFFKILTVATG